MGSVLSRRFLLLGTAALLVASSQVTAQETADEVQVKVVTGALINAADGLVKRFTETDQSEWVRGLRDQIGAVVDFVYEFKVSKAFVDTLANDARLLEQALGLEDTFAVELMTVVSDDIGLKY